MQNYIKLLAFHILFHSLTFFKSDLWAVQQNLFTICLPSMPFAAKVQKKYKKKEYYKQKNETAYLLFSPKGRKPRSD